MYARARRSRWSKPGGRAGTGEFKFSAERGEAVLTLEQTQAADHTLFTVDIEALITYSLPATGGAAAQRASVLVTVPMGARGVRKETAVVRLPAGAKPVALQVDPDHKVLFTLDLNPGTFAGPPSSPPLDGSPTAAATDGARVRPQARTFCARRSRWPKTTSLRACVL